MFPPNYFGDRHFGPNYWPPQLGIVLSTDDNLGGSQFNENPFLVFKPIVSPIKGQLPIGINPIEFSGSDTEIIIDDQPYGVVARKTPQEIIRDYEDLADILDKAVDKLGISRPTAASELYKQVDKALKQVEELKNTVFNDDEEIIMILIAADAL